ncbi:hypothetical protein [Haemophilus parainfluenzae]|jgi:hypothetical protein|uniref:hypothetical protein n=1 Tax=Haemophilus parainfluenzae TaxID=729 RepID=UPI000803235B|nr:hypothetical protein [Haemophilus parainfluenzae]OBX69249.1 hypothetical protein A9297_06115 [Haemophilus parainfluenzae]
MELNIISLWVQFITSMLFLIISCFLIFFWVKNRDKLRFFISLKDIIDQIEDGDSVSRVNKEQYKKVIIENSALGTNRKSDEVAENLSNLNDPAELEARKLLVSPNFIFILIIMIAVSLLYLFQASLGLGFIPQKIVSNELVEFVRKNILSQILKVFGVILTFLFMAYLFPLIKMFLSIIKVKFKNIWFVIKGGVKNILFIIKGRY